MNNNDSTDVKYNISISSHRKTSSCVEYLVLITSTTLASPISFYERYSSLKALNDLMYKEVRDKKNFPKFPPKKFFGSNDEVFIHQREKDLNMYFSSLSALPTINSFQVWVQEKIKKYSSEKGKKDTIRVSSSKEVTKQKVKRTKIKVDSTKCVDIIKARENLYFNFDMLEEINNPEIDEEKLIEYKKIVSDNELFTAEQIDSSSLFKVDEGSEKNVEILESNLSNQKQNEIDSVIKTKIAKMKNLFKEMGNVYTVENLIDNYLKFD